LRLTADDVVRLLRLEPHPEGGWYRETFRDAAGPDGRAQRLVLGADLGLGELPQAVVPAGWWQSATCLGDWTLVTCTVAPGFEFSSFEMAPHGWEPG